MAESDDLAPMPLEVVGRFVVLGNPQRGCRHPHPVEQVAEFANPADARWYVTARKAAEAMRMGCVPDFNQASWFVRNPWPNNNLYVWDADDKTIFAPDGLTALAMAYDVLKTRKARVT